MSQNGSEMVPLYTTKIDDVVVVVGEGVGVGWCVRVTLKDDSVPVNRNLAEFDGPEARFCPAGGCSVCMCVCVCVCACVGVCVLP